MRTITTILAATLALGAPIAAAHGQGAGGAAAPRFDEAAQRARQQLDDAIAELAALREQIAAETIPLSRKLSELEGQLTDLRLEYQQTVRQLDARTLDLTNLRNEIKARQEEGTYLSNLLGEYIRNFESRLHIAELQRYKAPLEEAKLALENTALSQEEVFEAQAALVSATLDRLLDVTAGTRFEGTAVDPNGLVRPGTFVLLGPAAIFRSADGAVVGTAEQRLGSLEPAVLAFGDPADADAASATAETGSGLFTLDPTQGNAHKVEATEETFVEHVRKGGPVMVPIFVLAGLALLVALYKWLRLLFVRKPSRRRVRRLLEAVGKGDRDEAMKAAKSVGGPTGRMLVEGVRHLDEPRELIEEVMYETVLTTRLKMQRLLPFIAICAASAPLLGLLGTVTGIINTFKLITVFGSGDVKTLSGGISEALITTEFGLIVAIPSLLLHAYLSRKARAVTERMEVSGLAFLNEVAKVESRRKAEAPPSPPPAPPAPAVVDPEMVRRETARQVKQAMAELLVPASAKESSA